MAKITKKQIKEDKFVSITTKIPIFFSEHWKKIVSIGASAIIVIGAIIAYTQYVSWKNDRAASILSEAIKLYDEAMEAVDKDGLTNSVKTKFDEARAKFQSAYQNGFNSSIKSEALFYSAKCLYQSGKYKEAISDFEIITKKYSKSFVNIPALKGIAKCYEQIGDNDSLRKAVQLYDEISKYPESYITISAIIDKGRCLEKLGEKQQAESAYKVIVDKFKIRVSASIQEKSKNLVQKAKNVISKYESVLGKDSSDPDYNSYLSQAKSLEESKQDKWFDVLVMYDKAIFTKNEYWYQQRLSGEINKAHQEAEKALNEYENESFDFIKNVNLGRKYERDGDWDNAIRYYTRAIRFEFLPDMDQYEEAQLRISQINSGKFES